jgi:hypothetical protein
MDRDAAAKLRYVTDVRAQTRRAVLLPSFSVLVVVGAVIGTHGVATGLWAGSAAASAVWVAGLLAARLLLRRPLGSPRLFARCAAVGVAAAVLAALTGANPLISGLAAVLAARAWLARMPLVALGALATGALVDAALLEVPTAAAEVLLGAALAVAGLGLRAWERR